MSDDGRLLDQMAARLRDEFDRSFAEPRAPDRAPGEDLLAIRIGSEPFALRLAELSGLFAERKIARLPGGPSTLLGIVGIRGAIMPVYDLPALLGRRSEETVRWLAIAPGQVAAFALATVEGYVRIDPAAIVPYDVDGRERSHVRDLAHSAGLVRPIVHLPSVIEAVRRLVAATSDHEH